MLNINSRLFDTEGNWKTYEHKFVVDGQEVGNAYLMVYDEDEDQAYVESIDIYEEHQSKGYGTEALKHLVSDYSDGIYLAPTNEDNQRLYNRLGEEMTGDVPEVDQGFGVYVIN